MSDNEPLISVIVPIYNVAPYLRKCLDSLKNQTMKEIEIICIDDGSTDDSGKIADEYAKKDERFQVIHTENRGLSAARNRGINEAVADWLMFVDSDDWVEQEFCRLPWNAREEYNADLIIFDRYLTTEQEKIKHEKKRIIPNGLIDHETAIDIGWPAAWNKMYHRTLFNEIKYPEGQVYEELLTTYMIVYAAQRITYISNKLYYYRIRRKGGITQSVSNDYSWLEASKQQTKKMIKLGYPARKAQINLWSIALKCCGRARNTNDTVYKEASMIIDNIKGIPSAFSLKEKLMLICWRISINLFRTAYKIARKMI